MFIWNYSKETLVNVEQITRIDILAPKYEQVDYVVSASILHHGTVRLYRGTYEACKEYLETFIAKNP